MYDQSETEIEILTSSQAERLEKFMIARNLKLNKKDISRAARVQKISVKKAILYFQEFENEIANLEWNYNEKLLKRLKRISKRVRKMTKQSKCGVEY